MRIRTIAFEQKTSFFMVGRRNSFSLSHKLVGNPKLLSTLLIQWSEVN